MVLKIFYRTFTPISNGTVYVNTSSAIILILNMAVDISGTGAAVSVTDQNGIVVYDLLRVDGISESLSVSGSNSFSTTATSSTGITNTSESVSESITGLNFPVNVPIRKGLLLQGWSIICNAQCKVGGFIALEADSIEELRGFL